MKILALEFSSDHRSVALVDGAVIGRTEEFGTRETHSFHLIETALAQAGLEREAVEVIAVGIGPGSYTGIRLAISLAQGWELACGVKLLAVSSVECVAAQAHQTGLRGRVAILVDAQRGEFYLAQYDLGENSWLPVDPLKIVSRETVTNLASDGVTLLGPEVTQWFPAGKTIFPDAAMLGCLAARRTDFIPGEKLEPIYLREVNFVKAPPRRLLAG